MRKERWMPWLVWSLRLLVGATFIASGLAKCIDLWGFAYKIEEYFISWGLSLPQTLYVMGAMALSVAEFVLGAVLLLGCYRRSAAILLLVMMVGMLPLSFYIYIANPVADCGCFGDFLVISNGATFVKNIVLTVAIILLVKFNRRIAGLYSPYLQWIVGLVCFVFAITVSLWGYNIQPLVDFRSFPVGTELLSSNEDDVDFEFIYKKGNLEKSFTADNLPDSTWVFVDRKAISGELSDDTELAIYDEGEDVTQDALASSGPQLIIAVPDFRLAGISYTYTINELSSLMDSIGGSLIEIVAMPDDMIEQWRDLSMAEYPIYTAEPTILKELVRGVMGAVYTIDGKIVWKRTLSSIDLEKLQNSRHRKSAIDSLAIDGSHVLMMFAGVLFVILAIVFLADRIIIVLKRNGKKFSESKKSGNFADENRQDSEDDDDMENDISR